MEHSLEDNNQQQRESLVDYIRSHPPLAEHLVCISRYLHREIPFKQLREHAISLPGLDMQSTPVNIRDLVYGLKENEFSVIQGYFMETLPAYMNNGERFSPVDKALDVIIDLHPIPDTARIPKDSEFHKGRPGRTLADMREEV